MDDQNEVDEAPNDHNAVRKLVECPTGRRNQNPVGAHSGRKGKLDGYSFYFHRAFPAVTGATLRWRCVEPTCKASVITYENLTIKKEPTHMHGPRDAAINQAEKALSTLKNNAKVISVPFYCNYFLLF